MCPAASCRVLVCPAVWRVLVCTGAYWQSWRILAMVVACPGSPSASWQWRVLVRPGASFRPGWAGLGWAGGGLGGEGRGTAGCGWAGLGGARLSWKGLDGAILGLWMEVGRAERG